MIESVKPKNKREEFEAIQVQLGDICYQTGKAYYEMELRKRSFADLEIKFHNLNKKAADMQVELAREERAANSKLSKVEGIVPEVPGQ